MTDPSKDSPEALRETIDRYNAAWNEHDLAHAIMAMHRSAQIGGIGGTPVRDWRAPDQAGQGRREAE